MCLQNAETNSVKGCTLHCLPVWEASPLFVDGSFRITRHRVLVLTLFKESDKSEFDLVRNFYWWKNEEVLETIARLFTTLKPDELHDKEEKSKHKSSQLLSSLWINVFQPFFEPRHIFFTSRRIPWHSTPDMISRRTCLSRHCGWKTLHSEGDSGLFPTGWDAFHIHLLKKWVCQPTWDGTE